MVQSKNRIFDEFARLTTDAIGAAQGLKREAEGILRGQAEKLVRDMDFASNEELQALRDMVVALKKENEVLVERIAALEGGKQAAKPVAKASSTRAKAVK